MCFPNIINHTLIEFLDYKCGYCKRAHEQISALLESNSEIRFVVKEFPILGKESQLASKASIAILLDQGGEIYNKFTKKLLTFNGIIMRYEIICFNNIFR